MYESKIHDNCIMTYCQDCQEPHFTEIENIGDRELVELIEYMRDHDEREFRKRGHQIKWTNSGITHYCFGR